MSASKTESLNTRWLDVFQPGIPISSGNLEPLNLGPYQRGHIHMRIEASFLDDRGFYFINKVAWIQEIHPPAQDDSE